MVTIHCDSAASVLKRMQIKKYAKDHISFESPQQFSDFIRDYLNADHLPHLIEVYEHFVGLTSLQGLRGYHKFVFDSKTNIISAFPSSLSAVDFKNVKQWTVEKFEVRKQNLLIYLSRLTLLLHRNEVLPSQIHPQQERSRRKAKKHQLKWKKKPTIPKRLFLSDESLLY
jgi:hypothetical protein